MILNAETCEMLFADRVVMVEGPSEQKLLPESLLSHAMQRRREPLRL